ncbi:hypothetical protein Poly24_19520 [Rosistilla carotiformis]|uniref:Uncharacterized protein n=1 Tax=Rosistilla carotiformis TaxID=2528017 RepID=A0A518JRR3_9BACT|nr:hypothetical protein Poly24_19520 [Rosistilla carotiformis]
MGPFYPCDAANATNFPQGSPRCGCDEQRREAWDARSDCEVSVPVMSSADLMLAEWTLTWMLKRFIRRKWAGFAGWDRAVVEAPPIFGPHPTTKSFLQKAFGNR